MPRFSADTRAEAVVAAPRADIWAALTDPALVADPLGRWLLGREIRARIAAYAGACADPEVLAVAQDTSPGGLG